VQPSPAIAETFIGQIEVARVEGVYMTEGQGRAAQLMLSDVRLGLRQGELLAIVGPSGSGKSELVQIMAGLLPADKGRVVVLNRDVPTYETAGRRLNLEGDREFVRWRARNIGYFNSRFQLDPKRSAYELVMQPMEVAGIGRDARERQERAIERLQLVGLQDPEVIRLKPTDLNRTEKQLVMLARALANDPPLLFCDEPLGNLTSKASNEVFNLLKRLLGSGKTVLMVTQDQFWAHNATRIIEILDGAIVGSLS
jgi:putative ABC transport system ATP-binding protein